MYIYGQDLNSPAIPIGTVILTPDGIAWQKTSDTNYLIGAYESFWHGTNPSDRSVSFAATDFDPEVDYKVIHQPKRKPSPNFAAILHDAQRGHEPAKISAKEYAERIIAS